MTADYNDQTNATIAKNVKHLRKVMGYSQEELSEKTGINRSTLNRIERGSGKQGPHLDSLVMIANVMEVPVHLLLDPNADFDDLKRQDNATMNGNVLVAVSAEDIDMMIQKMDDIKEYMSNSLRRGQIASSESAKN